MSYINFISFTVTGDCGNLSVGEMSFTITGDSPTWIVTEGPPYTGLLPLSGLTPGDETYYVGGLSAGTYSFTVQDTAPTGPTPPFSVTKTFNISSGTTVYLDAEGTTCGLNNGSLTGYTGNFYGNSSFYLYTFLGDYVTSAQTPYNIGYVIFPNLSADTYYVIGDDGGGCTGKSESVIINISSSFDYGYYAVDDASCINNQGSGKIYLTGLTTPTSAYTINWISNVNGQTGTTVTGLTQGLYTVEVTDTIGCTVQKNIQIVNVPKIGIGATYITSPGCFQNNGEVTVVVTGGTAPFYYYASNGDAFIGFGTSHTFTGLTNGILTITVTDAGLCNDTIQVNLVTPNSFGVVNVVTTNSNCNSNNGSIYITINNGVGTGNYNYTISGSNGTNQVNVAGGLSQTFQVGTGDYVILIDNGADCQYTGTTSVYNVDKYTITGLTLNTSCGLNNGTIKTSVSTGAIYPLSYQLVGPIGNSITTTQLNGNFSGLQAGTYNLTVTDATGCQQTIPIYIAPSSPMYFDFMTFNPVLGNDGQINVLITSGTPPFSYTWTGNVGIQTGIVITGLTSGVYSLTIVDNNGCSFTRIVKLKGTELFGTYSVFNICEQNFEDSNIVGKRGILQMFNEGFYDLTSGDTNCIVNSAEFNLQVIVGGDELINTIYNSTGLDDYPSEVVWADSLIEMLQTFVGIGDVTIDYVNNKITITNDCEEILKNCRTETYNLLNDTNITVNLIINYDISCVSCAPTPTPDILINAIITNNDEYMETGNDEYLQYN